MAKKEEYINFSNAIKALEEPWQQENPLFTNSKMSDTINFQ